MRVGFIGVGRLGSQLVERLVEGDFESLVLYDAEESAVRRFVEAGALVAASIGQVASSAPDVVGVCVQNDAQLEDVVAGVDGLLAAPLPAGAVIAVHSTVHPETCRRLAADAEAVGVTLIDAAISNGGRTPGATPTRVVLVGSDPETFRRCLSYFEGVGDLIEHVGELGSGEVLKLLNNLLMVLNMGTTDTVMRFGEALGLPVEVMTRALSTGSGSSQGVRTLLAAERAAHNQVVLGKDLGLAVDVLRAGGCDVDDVSAAGQAAIDAMVERAAIAGSGPGPSS